MTSKLLIVTITFLILGLIYESLGVNLDLSSSSQVLESSIESEISSIRSVRERTGVYRVTLYFGDGSRKQYKMTLSESNQLILSFHPGRH